MRDFARSFFSLEKNVIHDVDLYARYEKRVIKFLCLESYHGGSCLLLTCEVANCPAITFHIYKLIHARICLLIFTRMAMRTRTSQKSFARVTVRLKMTRQPRNYSRDVYRQKTSVKALIVWFSTSC